MAADYPYIGKIEGGDKPYQSMNTSAKNAVIGLNYAEVLLMGIAT